jgi:hypothetical protein
MEIPEAADSPKKQVYRGEKFNKVNALLNGVDGVRRQHRFTLE